MKKIILVAVYILINSCQQSKDKVSTESFQNSVNKQVTIEMEAFRNSFFLNFLGYHDITPNDLFDLGWECVNTYRTDLINKCFGGYLKKTSFSWPEDSIPNKYKGLLVFPCLKYKDDGSTIDSIYFAYKAINDFSKIGTNFTLNDESILYKTTNHYTYPGPFPADRTKMKNFLVDDKNVNADDNMTLTYLTVKALSSNFIDKFKYAGRPANVHKYGFFVSYEVQEVLNQEESSIGLRLHFGFDGTANANRIKLTLCLVDSVGNNMIFSPQQDSRVILERHWPPS